MANTSFLTLKQNALKIVDHSISDTAALSIMGTFINQTIQEIANSPQGRKLVEDYGTVSTVADQEYVELSNLTGTRFSGYAIDEISKVYQKEDDIDLDRITIQQYRYEFPDPSVESGNPYLYARWAERLYLRSRPSAVITLYVDFWVVPSVLSADGDACDFAPRFDEWVLTGAAYRWKKTFEAEDQTQVVIAKNAYDEASARFGLALNREPDRRPVAKSQGCVRRVRREFVSPAGQ